MSMEQVKEVKYGKKMKADIGQTQEQIPDIQYFTLDIILENGETISVMNGDWEMNNPALKVLAFLGASPTDLDAAKGNVIMVDEDNEGNPIPHHSVYSNGVVLLKNTGWFNPDA